MIISNKFSVFFALMSLFRMFNSLEVADFPNNFSHHSKTSYNPGIERRQENSDHLGISHEHTDSGLGTEQDCIYNSEKYFSPKL